MSAYDARGGPEFGMQPAGAKIVAPRAPQPSEEEAPPEEMGEEPQGPPTTMGKLMQGLSSLWATRQIIETTDSDIQIKTTLRELIIYIVFLILLCVVTFGMMSATMFYYTSAMSNVFATSTASTGVSFSTMQNMDDFWAVMQGPILAGLYPDAWYNGQNYSQEDMGFVLHENRLLGIPRMRQVRMSNDSCIVPGDFQSTILVCYDTYTTRLEDTDSFGLMNGTAWEYHTPKALHGSSFTGQIATYGGGGFYTDLMHSQEVASAIMADLMANLWVDRGTRAVFLDFTVYNANINLFCVIKLLAEFPASGGAVSSMQFSTVKLIRYVSASDYFVMACEILFMILVLYYIVEETLEIRKHKLSYFKTFSNVMDVVILIMAVCCAVFSVYRTVAVNNMLNDLLTNPDLYPDFTFLSYWQETFNQTLAIMLFASWIKIFKYISFNKTMTQLSSTMGKCSKDLAGFAIMFFIIFLAFAQLGYLLFGSQLQEYNSFATSIFSLFRIVLGDFNFPDYIQANRILGPAFFIVYVFFVFFILLNMFLAIINDTYSEVKSELAEQRNEFEMGEFFKKGAVKMMERMNLKKERIMDLEQAMEMGDSNGDGVLDYDEWRRAMKTRGYAEAEIEAVFAKYDSNGDRGLDLSEQRSMQADLEKQKTALDEDGRAWPTEDQEGVSGRPREGKAKKSSAPTKGGGEGSEELQRRVARLEQKVGECLSKVEGVLGKLEVIKRSRGGPRGDGSSDMLLGNIKEGDAAESKETGEEAEAAAVINARPLSSRYPPQRQRGTGGGVNDQPGEESAHSARYSTKLEF